MGKTFKRNEGRRPKWDKRGKKSNKIRNYEDDKFKHHPKNIPLLDSLPIETDELGLLPIDLEDSENSDESIL